MLEFLRQDPARFFGYALYRVPAVLVALVFHEFAHGFVADRLGDPTARASGRLTLNPLPHLDLVGTLLMIFLGFGWAKPVPVNPLNFKGENPHRSDLFVSIAGVCMNLLLFLTCTLLSLAVTRFLWDPDVLRWYDARELLGFDSDIFLAIQLGYFEGLSDFFLRPALVPVLRFLAQTAMVNLYIAVFNLLPVPPLDGSHVFNDLLLKKNLFVQKRTAQIGMALVLLLSFTGWLGQGLSFIADNIQAGLLFLVGSLAHAGL